MKYKGRISGKKDEEAEKKENKEISEAEEVEEVEEVDEEDDAVDIGLSKKSKKGSYDAARIISAVVGCVALIVFVFSLYKIIEKQHEYSVGVGFYSEIAEAAKIPPDTASSADSGSEGDIAVDAAPSAPFKVDFQKLSEENGDIVAWIYAKDTSIDYPVVQSGDNDFYLRRMLNGQWNIAGTIFMDYRFPGDFSGFNSVIYGHNMNNGSMFGSLGGYKEQEYYDEHPEMWLFTKDKTYRVDVFAGFVTDAASTDVYGVCSDREALDSYIDYATEHSAFKSDVERDTIEKVVVLSTCSYETNSSRFVLYGSLVPIED